MQKLKLMPKITAKMHELAVTSSFRINFVLPMIKHQFFGELWERHSYSLLESNMFFLY